MLAFRPGVEPSLEVLGKFLGSPEEALCEGLRRIMLFHGRRRADTRGSRCSGKEFGRRTALPSTFCKVSGNDVAAIAMCSRRQEGAANEGMTTDIETVAHLLPYCDAMFMDNECRSCC